MTRADVICNTFQFPVRNWIIDNVQDQRRKDWLDRDAGDFGRRNINEPIQAYRVLDEAFSWSYSKEGYEFWNELFDKLRIKNI